MEYAFDHENLDVYRLALEVASGHPGRLARTFYRSRHAMLGNAPLTKAKWALSIAQNASGTGP